MAEINNLDIITDQIYKEGIEKAEVTSKAILAKAESESSRLLAEAKEEAAKLVNEAKREAERVARSVENELQLKGKQMISDLKREVKGTLNDKILHDNGKKAFADVAFLQSAVLEAISCWKSTDSLEIVIPKSLEKKWDSAFHRSVSDHAKNLTITFSDQLSGGFRISEKGEGYQISFSEEDFIRLFASYLDRQTQQILFREST
ncbi:MAG: V-type ATP synthase subunit E [Cyclobacteriaceae bacterium]|nr:V-type ATP synthase subunit E [Cyclobacteriaceae bacterium HetDA_MAG_MS6]